MTEQYLDVPLDSPWYHVFEYIYPHFGGSIQKNVVLGGVQEISWSHKILPEPDAEVFFRVVKNDYDPPWHPNEPFRRFLLYKDEGICLFSGGFSKSFSEAAFGTGEGATFELDGKKFRRLSVAELEDIFSVQYTQGMFHPKKKTLVTKMHRDEI